MNKRIRELATEAGYKDFDYAIIAHKFAELIIQECARVADCPSSFKHTNGYKILRHFNVKEIA